MTFEWRIYLVFTLKDGNSCRQIVHLSVHLISEDALINKTWTRVGGSQTETGRWNARGKIKRLFCYFAAFKKEGEHWKRKERDTVRERSGESGESSGVWTQHQSRRWEDRGGMKRENDKGRERQSDRELFDEFIWVRSWVAWSQGLTVVEKAERSVLIDTLALWMEDPSFACPWHSTLPPKALNWFVF